MKHFILILILIVVTTKVLFPQNDEIARTGSSVITLEEFHNRYEFMPHLNYSTDNPDTLRKAFLYSLIAEKLWAMEAIELSYDTLEAVRYSMENLRKLLIKDELYKEEVESKINITDEEIAKGLLKVNRILKVNIISSRDSSRFSVFQKQ
ncbi:MAG: hypothetical protein Q7S39_02390 [Ignavibacteria bacterium]|nr:hypothetical protein [Ignavibacteria bacterium]